VLYQLWHLLADSAARHPNAAAIRLGDQRLSYSELDLLSGKFATALITHGLAPGDRVGLFFPKSIASLVTIFGILKAGGVYVPIDPASPRARLAYIVRNCGIRHLVTVGDRVAVVEEALSEDALGALDAIYAVDGASPQSSRVSQRVLGWSDVMLSSPARPHDGVESDLAYILYTSGSTGAPKGVMISHRAALTFIDWTHDEFDVSPRDVVSSHAPLHFDLSIFDVFTTIKGGGTIVPVPDRLSTFPLKLAAFIREQKISIWYSVPSALTLMLQRGKFASATYPDLRTVLFAGEVFPIKYLKQMRRAVDSRLYNLYGPTETNVCTYYEVTSQDLERDTDIPIGKAIRNYDVFVLNDAGARIAAGDGEGELFARGPGLMSGYWGDAEKTARTLRANPLGSEMPNEKVMATGDMVTVAADGNFVFAGRRDNMIKSRGYRIELGEIEAALYRHPSVREAAVVAVPDELLTNRLKAFVVLNDDAALGDGELQTFCRDYVPNYMIPETIVLRSELPRTSTGKVDRQRLSAQ